MRGFTLIELIMTIVLVGIVSIPLSLLIAQHITSAAYSKDTTLAFNLARWDMEQVNYRDTVPVQFRQKLYSAHADKCCSHPGGEALHFKKFNGHRQLGFLYELLRCALRCIRQILWHFKK